MVQMHMMIVNYGCGTCRSKPCANSFAPMFFDSSGESHCVQNIRQEHSRLEKHATSKNLESSERISKEFRKTQCLDFSGSKMFFPNLKFKSIKGIHFKFLKMFRKISHTQC